MKVEGLFLDSGAYSARTQGVEITLKDYIAFAQRHRHLVHAHVCLDVIPGPVPVEVSASRSYENQQRMKDAGLGPIPVFHQYEEFKWLERLLTDGETYIGLSPDLDAHHAEIRQWLDQCFRLITDSRSDPAEEQPAFPI